MIGNVKNCVANIQRFFFRRALGRDILTHTLLWRENHCHPKWTQYGFSMTFKVLWGYLQCFERTKMFFNLKLAQRLQKDKYKSSYSITESCQEALLSTNPVSEVDYWVQNVKNWKSRGMGRLTLQKQKNYIWSDFLSKNGFWNFLFCCNPFRSANFRRL